MSSKHREDDLLRSAALQNANSILRARQRAEEELLEAKEDLRRSNERITRILESITDGFVVVDADWRFTYVNPKAEELLAPMHKTRANLLGRVLWEEFPQLAGTEIGRAYRRAMDEKVTIEIESFFAPLGGWFAVRAFPAPDSLSIYFHDVTRRKEAESALASEKTVLEMIATGAPQEAVLERLAREAEAQSVEGMLCSIQLLDDTGKHLVQGAAPSFPAAYNKAIDGIAIGTHAGSCGTAAFLGRPVWVTDIATDERWRDFRELAATHGLRACCSTPFFSSRGDVLGTVAMYYRESREPSERDARLIEQAARLAGIVIERKRSEEMLRSREERLRASFEQAAVGIAIAGMDGRFVEMNRKFCEILGYGENELRELTFTDITLPEDRPATEPLVRELLAGTRTDYSIEKRYMRRDGIVVWALATVTLLRDPAGEASRFIGVVEDISARKRTEEALRSSEDQLRQLANSIPQLAWMAEPDGNIFWYNRRWFEYTGTALDEMKGWGWQSVHDPAILPSVVEAWTAAIASAVPFEMEFPLRSASGEFRWFLTRVNPLRDDGGRVVRWFGTNTDVEQVRRIRQALEDETRILELLNRTGAALASNLDLQALLQAITDSATQLSGAQFGAFFYNVIDERGKAFMLYTLSGAPREAFEGFGQPRATPIFAPTFQGEGIIRLDDVTRDARYGQMGAPHHGMPHGHPPVRSYLAVPVTARSGEAIGGLFFGHSEVGVFTERSERLVAGVAAQAAVAIDNARLYEAAQKASEERKHLLESERHARAAAERASGMKDEFLATLSHELRTPLSAILGWSQILRTRVPKEEELRKGLETIERNARVQTQLIEDLLDMSRITSGKVRLDVQPVMPAALLEAALETVRPSAEAKGVRLEAMLDPSAGPVSADPSRLQQVVWNLLTNAIKFTPRDGKVQVVLQRVESHLEISIADTGVGIDPRFLGHVFERFRQADGSSTRQFGGLGLGLSIVKHLVELHGGTVSAASPGAGEGSTFIVSLPLAVVHRGQAPSRQHPKAAPSTTPDFKPIDLTGVTVLVVDDQVDARELVTRVLSDCGANVAAAGNAEEALALVESMRPDVLVSDIGMPDVDGYELLRRVRALGESRGGKVPAIALTAFARSEDRTRALHRGFQVHVAKPVEPAELIATVASVAGRAGEA